MNKNVLLDQLQHQYSYITIQNCYERITFGQTIEQTTYSIGESLVFKIKIKSKFFICNYSILYKYYKRNKTEINISIFLYVKFQSIVN